MKRLARYLSTILTLLCLLLLPAILALWYWSYHANHVIWIRSQISNNQNRLRTDYFVCDRGLLGWSHQTARFPNPGPDRTIWKSYAHSKYSADWNYRLDLTSKTWPAIGQ